MRRPPPPRVQAILKGYQEMPESHFLRRGRLRALRQFHAMARRVPAYRDFLKKHHIHPERIRSMKDFASVPPVDKTNYLTAYPREALMWDGAFSQLGWTIATTSGSTGEPYYFPRLEKHNADYAAMAELYLRTNFQIHKRTTLYIIGFPMGAWIGGVFTLQALMLLRDSGKYPLSIITPGINKLEIIKAVKNLGPHFDQIIIGSYGPFLKDTLDEGKRLGLDWTRYRLGFIFSAEGFSESFRDYVIRLAGLTNPYTSTLNHYGTVDLGTMAHETPIAILIRRLALSRPRLYTQLFGQITKLPTLTQYNPEHYYFEDIDGNLVCTADSGIPLVRYNLKDHGGVRTFDHIRKILTDNTLSLESIAKENDIASTVWHLPFVYVYERSDFSVSFFAFQIYPETIRKALYHRSLTSTLTGKFTMMVRFDTRANQSLTIHLELKYGKKPTTRLKRTAVERIMGQLLAENSEFRKTHEEYPKQTIPEIHFWPYEHPTHFAPGGKQKWVKK